MVATQLQSCAVVAIGAVGATALVANDRRTVGTQIDDQNAENRISILLAKHEEIAETAHIRIDVFNKVALLTGQAPQQHLIEEAEDLIKDVEYVTKVHNQIRVGEPISASSSSYDFWLASKVRSKILASDKVPALQVNVIVENKEVFLMGKVTNLEATTAVDIARHVDGVTRVVRAFEIL
jgi:osmotically-inducible protein OsmY